MITWDDFDKIWASTSPLTPYSFSDPNYSQGWNFVGSTPPARQMWDSIQKKNDEKFKYLRDNFGTPNIVTSSSQMTDTDKVYVYMGSEAGWNSGHWYYYDEGTSSWADGGVYNSVAFVTDTTLSIAGQPADAKATGDALALKSDLAGCTFTGNVGINADFSVTGDATIGTDLSVTGVSTLTGNVSAGADVTVVGDVSSANLTTSADATIGGNLSVTGTSTLAGNITTSGDISADNISATTNATVGGNLSVTGTSTLTGNINAGADIVAVGDVSADNLTTTTNATVGGSLSVAGTSTLTGNVTASGNISAVGDITSANISTTNATIGGNATVTGDVSCANLTTSADATVGGDLTVTGDSTLADASVNNDLSVAGDSSLTNLSVSGTTALAGTSTAVTPSADDNSTNIATTEYVQTEIKPIEVNADIVNKRVTNIEKLLQGNLYDYQTDSDSKYTKSVPQGAMPYASLDSIGGKTVVMNQIFPSLNASNLTVNATAGTLTDNGDGTVTYTLTTESTYAYIKTNVADIPLMISGHNYYCRIDIKTPGTSVSMRINNSNTAFKTWSGLTAGTRTVLETIGAITTGETNPAKYIYPTWTTIATGECILYSVTLVDLTLLYGSGNEPTTVAEFQAQFPAQYYPYNAGTLLSAGVTEVKSVGINQWDEQWSVYGTGSNARVGSKNPIPVLPNTEYTFVAPSQPANGIKFYTLDMVQTGATRYNTGTFTTPADCYFVTFQMGASAYGAEYHNDISLNRGTNNAYHPFVGGNYPIPAEIQALEGYGWSAGSVYNYVDFERKVFVKNVGKMTLDGDFYWNACVALNDGSGYYVRSSNTTFPINENKNNSVYSNRSFATTGSWESLRYGEVAYNAGRSIVITVPPSASTTALANQWFADNPTDIYYELATPIETDISAYITDDNLISVESGGTLTFPNSNGTDYQIPVPSSETYMVDLQSAI